MKKITLKSIEIENFKGIQKRTVEFSGKTRISGMNATGKTSIFDAFTWLLFNKDSSGSEKFDLRPLDGKGETIHHVEISVKALLSVDGNEVELHKTQKEKWVKKRGSETADLQGNENVYEIDGYPKTEKEYKAYIADMVNEDLFKMLTNPQAFVTMPWKDQRNILMEFVADISDIEIAEKEERFSPLVDEIRKAPSLDDIKKKYSKAKTEWDAKLKEIPARIDEVSKMKCEVNVEEQELARKELENKIADIDSKSKSAKGVVSELEQKKFELQFEINDCKRKANEGIERKRRELSDRVYESEQAFNKAHYEIGTVSRDIEDKRSSVNRLESEKKELGNQYMAENKKEFDGVLQYDDSKWIFDESSTVCSLCGQMLPEDKIKALRAEFADRKAKAKEDAENKLKSDRERFESGKKNEVERIKTLGFEKKSRIESLKTEIAELEKKLPDLQNAEIEAHKKSNEYQTELDSIPKEADLSGNEGYQELLKKDAEYQKQIDSAKENEVDTTELDKQKAELESQLREVNSLIAKANQNEEIDERIKSLTEEQRDISQKVADQEKLLFLLEEFIREKMKLISETINKHFNLVNFKLFDIQINGGLKECCECTVNGVPYSTLNSGHRIVAGLDIINSLSQLKQVEAPIFTDNAESVNDFNIPSMEAQMIFLSVSDDKELKVESEV